MLFADEMVQFKKEIKDVFLHFSNLLLFTILPVIFFSTPVWHFTEGRVPIGPTRWAMWYKLWSFCPIVLSFNCFRPFAGVDLVLVIATSTSNRNILLTRNNLVPSIVYVKQILCKAPSLNVSLDNVSLILLIFISNNLLPLPSPLTQAGWLTSTMPCQKATRDFVRHCLFSIFTVNLHIWRPFPYPQHGNPVDGRHHLHTIISKNKYQKMNNMAVGTSSNIWGFKWNPRSRLRRKHHQNLQRRWYKYIRYQYWRLSQTFSREKHN